MTAETFQYVQAIGSIVSLWIVLNEFIKHLKEWRGGSPELRLLKETLKATLDNQTKLLDNIVQRLERL
jgi:hypothetical protein